MFIAASADGVIFFFQAEDGIRDYKVTGVQTCALPILDPMVSHICQRDGNLFRVHKELVLEGGDGINEMVQMFHEAVPSHHGDVWIYGDATGRNRHHQTARSSYQLIVNLMRTYGSPLRLKVPEANPHVPDRINAVNRALKD